MSSSFPAHFWDFRRKIEREVCSGYINGLGFAPAIARRNGPTQWRHEIIATDALGHDAGSPHNHRRPDADTGAFRCPECETSGELDSLFREIRGGSSMAGRSWCRGLG
jgi:hypothetical protein